EYLTLDRAAATLSGGEAQRIRLATQIGSRLMGVMYVLDEPSIGLHPRDNARLIHTLISLRDIGNTLLVVEHDEETMRSADWIIDIGPGAGEHGGRIVAEGTFDDIYHHPDSITGQYLSGRRSIPVPETRRRGNGKRLVLTGARENNLKNVTAEFPLGTFICVTGVSGSGKSTLITDTLYRRLAQILYRAHDKPGKFDELRGAELIDKVIDIDQSPIGRTPRSNPATYTGAFTYIRELFAAMPEAKARGYKPGRFSFNVKGGRCEACAGEGIVKIEMNFLPDVYVPCEVCHGKRYNREAQEILYKGKSIADVLDMTVAEGLEFFENVPKIANKLRTLNDVGLGYIHLGQPATQLSGGEAQRVKLATELSRRATGRTMYILDEPTTGLHFADIERLLGVLQRLTDAGNTILVIEHNLEVIKSADWIIDLGPEGGDRGGEIIAVGTPEQIAENDRSYTGHALQRLELVAHQGHGTEELGPFRYRHVEDVGDRLVLELDLQRLAVVALAVAGIARDIDIGQEVHLDLDDAVALAGLAAPALHVEREAAGLIAARLGLGEPCEPVANGREGPGIGGRVRARRAADRRLVDVDDLVQIFQPLDPVMVARMLPRAVQLPRQG
ncbi:MAG: excinuclease ABC subunit UvrA, partial [Vicinamibacterales bacterium]